MAVRFCLVLSPRNGTILLSLSGLLLNLYFLSLLSSLSSRLPSSSKPSYDDPTDDSSILSLSALLSLLYLLKLYSAFSCLACLGGVYGVFKDHIPALRWFGFYTGVDLCSWMVLELVAGILAFAKKGLEKRLENYVCEEIFAGGEIWSGNGNGAGNPGAGVGGANGGALSVDEVRAINVNPSGPGSTAEVGGVATLFSFGSGWSTVEYFGAGGWGLENCEERWKGISIFLLVICSVVLLLRLHSFVVVWTYHGMLKRKLKRMAVVGGIGDGGFVERFSMSQYDDDEDGYEDEYEAEKGFGKGFVGSRMGIGAAGRMVAMQSKGSTMDQTPSSSSVTPTTNNPRRARSNSEVTLVPSTSSRNPNRSRRRTGSISKSTSPCAATSGAGGMGSSTPGSNHHHRRPSVTRSKRSMSHSSFPSSSSSPSFPLTPTSATKVFVLPSGTPSPENVLFEESELGSISESSSTPKASPSIAIEIESETSTTRGDGGAEGGRVLVYRPVEMTLEQAMKMKAREAVWLDSPKAAVGSAGLSNPSTTDPSASRVRGQEDVTDDSSGWVANDEWDDIQVIDEAGSEEDGEGDVTALLVRDRTPSLSVRPPMYGEVASASASVSAGLGSVSVRPDANSKGKTA